MISSYVPTIEQVGCPFYKIFSNFGIIFRLWKIEIFLFINVTSNFSVKTNDHINERQNKLHQSKNEKNRFFTRKTLSFSKITNKILKNWVKHNIFSIRYWPLVKYQELNKLIDLPFWIVFLFKLCISISKMH